MDKGTAFEKETVELARQLYHKVLALSKANAGTGHWDNVLNEACEDLGMACNDFCIVAAGFSPEREESSTDSPKPE